jgi:CRP-like cAMP-binding protein
MIATTHYSRPQVLERWRECIWADRVSDAAMQNLVMPSLQVRHLRAGQSIWRVGDEALHWVGVLGGAAKLCVQLEDGRAVTLCSVAGSWIGEVELLRGVRLQLRCRGLARPDRGADAASCL